MLGYHHDNMTSPALSVEESYDKEEEVVVFQSINQTIICGYD